METGKCNIARHKVEYANWPGIAAREMCITKHTVAGYRHSVTLAYLL